MPDHYTYPGTEVLINRLGITDEREWKAVETAAIGQRMIELDLAPIRGGFDLAHLQAIHAHLAQDLYTWGGKLRDTDTGPGGTGLANCRPAFIPAEAERIFAALRDADSLRDRDADGFSRGLAWVWGETTVLHPFRDVNTRSQFAFFNQLARAAGWAIDWERIDPQGIRPRPHSGDLTRRGRDRRAAAPGAAHRRRDRTSRRAATEDARRRSGVLHAETTAHALPARPGPTHGTGTALWAPGPVPGR